MRHNPVEDALSALFSGAGRSVGRGIEMGFQRGSARQEAEARRRAQIEDMAQMARNRFAASEAGEREGSASQVEDVFNFLSQPPEQRSAANMDLSMLLSDNPAISMQGIPSGQPAITPGAASGMLSDPIREALMARMLPREKKQFAPRAAAAGKTFNFSVEANRALDSVRENLGLAGRMKPLGPAEIRAAAAIMTATKGRPLTPEEFAALTKLGKQPRREMTAPEG